MTLSPDGEVFKSNFFIIDSPPLCSPRGIRVLIPQGERAIKLINARLHGEYGSSVFDPREGCSMRAGHWFSTFFYVRGITDRQTDGCSRAGWYREIQVEFAIHNFPVAHDFSANRIVFPAR